MLGTTVELKKDFAILSELDFRIESNEVLTIYETTFLVSFFFKKASSYFASGEFK